MPDVVLTRVKFISDQDLDELEKEINSLLTDFEVKHKVKTFAEIEILKRQ